jgi:glucan biosynthesis protein C
MVFHNEGTEGGAKMETQSIRRYDLDWLRVLAILAVFVYHSGMFFSLDDWHVKNPTTYSSVEIWVSFLRDWMMPLIFLISGASLFFALGKGGAGRFVKGKVLRLLVPLVVGIFTHAILAVYLERLTHGEFEGSFFEFVPHYFEGLYPYNGGNFAWMGIHLWYLEMLFVFSLIFLPLFLWFKSRSGQRVLSRIGGFLAGPGAVYLLSLPTILLVNLLDTGSFLGSREWGGWSPVVYITFFLSGYVIISNERLQKSIQRLRWLSLALGITLGVARIMLLEPGSDTLYELSAWFWILTLLGFGMKHLNFNTPILKHATEAVLPFYILHQTVLLSVGYFVVHWDIPDLVKWLIITLVSLGIISGLYEYVVRHNNVLRFLFGMKPTVKSKPFLVRVGAKRVHGVRGRWLSSGDDIIG